MKKLLSLLGAVSLTATASLAVVSCANLSDYNDFANWVNETKVQYKGDTGEVTKKGSSIVIYIGSKDNASSLSFQAAVEEFLDPIGHNFNVGLSNLSKSNEDLNWNIDVASGLINDNDSLAKEWGTATVKKEKPKKKSAYWTRTNLNENQKLVIDKKDYDTKMEKAVTFKSIILKEMSDLWSNKSMKKIVSDVIEANVARTLFSANINSNDKQITEMVNTIVSSLTSVKGPMFITVRNGVITGFVNGFELFHEFNQNDANAIDKTIANNGKQLRKESLTNLLEAITIELNSSIEDHMLNQESNFSLNSQKTGTETFKTWDEGKANFDKDKKTQNRPYSYSLSDEYLETIKASEMQ